MSRAQSEDMKPGYRVTLHPQNVGCNPVLRLLPGQAGSDPACAQILGAKAQPICRTTKSASTKMSDREGTESVRTSSKRNVDPVRLATDREGQPRGRRGRIGDRLAVPDPAFARLVDLHRDPFVR